MACSSFSWQRPRHKSAELVPPPAQPPPPPPPGEASSFLAFFPRWVKFAATPGLKLRTGPIRLSGPTVAASGAGAAPVGGAGGGGWGEGKGILWRHPFLGQRPRRCGWTRPSLRQEQERSCRRDPLWLGLRSKRAVPRMIKYLRTQKGGLSGELILMPLSSFLSLRLVALTRLDW